MSALADFMHLTPGLALFALATCLCAGIIRGFAGFGLSALAMAMLAAFIPPIELIPVFWFLEMTGSLMLMRGGLADADRSIVLPLIVSSALGLPVGLLISLAVDTAVSKAVALTALIVLALMQLARLRIGFLATPRGTYAAGAVAGIVTGVAGAGGMFIALFALARDLPARVMRGSLNIYLLGAGVLGLVTHLLIGTMDATAVARAGVLVPAVVLGVVLGRAAFIPRWERYYRPACLVLLLGLASAGLIRLIGDVT